MVVVAGEVAVAVVVNDLLHRREVVRECSCIPPLITGLAVVMEDDLGERQTD